MAVSVTGRGTPTEKLKSEIGSCAVDRGSRGGQRKLGVSVEQVHTGSVRVLRERSGLEMEM